MKCSFEKSVFCSECEVIGFFYVNLLTKKKKRYRELRNYQGNWAGLVSHRELTLSGKAVKIKSPALRNFYCEMVFLSVRLMKMSANGMRFCQMELLSPPIQLGRGVNQYINLISSWEDGFETGHFCFSLEKPEKIIILKIHITNILLPSRSTSSAYFCKDTARMDVWAVEG